MPRCPKLATHECRHRISLNERFRVDARIFFGPNRSAFSGVCLRSAVTLINNNSAVEVGATTHRKGVKPTSIVRRGSGRVMLDRATQGSELAAVEGTQCSGFALMRCTAQFRVLGQLPIAIKSVATIALPGCARPFDYLLNDCGIQSGNQIFRT